MNYKLLLPLLLFSLFLFGCTQTNIPGIPFTFCQLVSKTYLPDGVTNADCNMFYSGDLNNFVLGVGGPDGNSPQWYNINDLNSGGGTGSNSWNDLTDFPTGCGANQAVQIIGTTLTCIDINYSSYTDANTLAVINSLDLNNTLEYLKTYTDTNFETAGFGDLNMDLNYLQTGNNISELVNDSNYQSYNNVLDFDFLTSYIDTNLYSIGDINSDKYFQIDLNTIGNLKADSGYLCNDVNCYLISDLNITSSGGGYTNLTSFVNQTAWRLFYSNGDGDVTELTLGTSGQYLKSTGTTTAPTWDTPAGGSGSPAGSDTEIQFNDSGSFGADSNLTYDGTTFTTNNISTSLLKPKIDDTMDYQGRLIFSDINLGSFTQFQNYGSALPVIEDLEPYIYGLTEAGAYGSLSVNGYITFTSGAENGNTFSFATITKDADGTHDFLSLSSMPSSGAGDTFNLFIKPKVTGIDYISATTGDFSTSINTASITGLSSFSVTNADITDSRSVISVTGRGSTSGAYATNIDNTMTALAGAGGYAHKMQLNFGSTTSELYGLYLRQFSVSGVNNPSVNQIMIYNDDQRNKTDTDNKMWFIYNNNPYITGKNLLGKDNVKTYFGSDMDSAISYDGTNLVLDGNTSDSNTLNKVWITSNGEVTANSFNMRSDVKTGNQLETIKDGTELLNPDGSINHKAFEECYVGIKATDFNRPVIEEYECEIELEDGSIEKGICKRTIYPFTKIEDSIRMDCVLAKTYQALANVNNAMKVGEGLIDTTNILAENIYTKSKVPEPEINYCKMIQDANIYDKASHYAYVEKNGRFVLDAEYRWVVLEGCEKQKLNEMCIETNHKYSWCPKYKPK